jgi:hypothetical protein
MDSRRVADREEEVLVQDKVAADEKADALARDEAMKAIEVFIFNVRLRAISIE